MKKLSLFTITFAILLSPVALCAANNISSSTMEKQCPQLASEEKTLMQWTASAMRSQSSIGCGNNSVDLALSRLETAAQQKTNNCGAKAAGLLLAFYATFSEHPSYAMCGFKHKMELLSINLAEDGRQCKNLSLKATRTCFYKISVLISTLKISGEIKPAIELARKTANSGDVTGISQLTLALAYQFGNGGLALDLHKAIKWHKEALKRLPNDYEKSYLSLRISSIMSLAVAYEDLKDYKSAIYYYEQCAKVGDADCKVGLTRLKKLKTFN